MDEEVPEGVRIFVGGLGENVSSDEVRKIFSALGCVEAVDIIRTKGRSFGYVDFIPASPKALANLFSTYNGCVWKGGRLRLEKAKQHYLARLQQEWAQDALHPSPPPPPPPAQDLDTSNSKPTQLRIFFPALRKAKQVPLTGTGKHKYSFRRVEVPSLPTLFCDCEQHSSIPSPVPSVAAQQKPITLDDGLNEKEFQLMDSLLNKLLSQKESIEFTNSTKLSPDLPDDQLTPDLHEEESTSDEDNNLVINVVNQKNKKSYLANEESRFNKRRLSQYTSIQDASHKRTRNTSTPSKNAKPLIVERDTNESISSDSGVQGKLHPPCPSEPRSCLGARFVEATSGVKQSTPSLSWSQKSSWKNLVGDSNSSLFSVSDKFSGLESDKDQSKSCDVNNASDNKKNDVLGHENQKEQLGSSKVEGLAVAQPTGQDSASNRSGRGSAWLQKSSWTQLIGGNNSSSFSILQILPGITDEKQEPGKLDTEKLHNADGGKEHDIGEMGTNKPDEKGYMAFGVRKDHNVQTTSDVVPNQALSRDVAIGETCCFMKTDASVNEWHKLKEALSGKRKRKSNERQLS